MTLLKKPFGRKRQEKEAGKGGMLINMLFFYAIKHHPEKALAVWTITCDSYHKPKLKPIRKTAKWARFQDLVSSFCCNSFGGVFFSHWKHFQKNVPPLSIYKNFPICCWLMSSYPYFEYRSNFGNNLVFATFPELLPKIFSFPITVIWRVMVEFL